MVRAVKTQIEKQTAPSFGEFGTTAVRTSYGSIFDERLPKLTGVRAREIYRQMMDNDPVVGAMMLAVEQSMRSVRWKVDPEVPTDQAKRDADFVWESMNDMSHPWQDFVTDVLTMLGYGWSWFEIVYKRRAGGDEDGPPEVRSKYDDRQVGWRKFAIRSQTTLERWQLDPKGGVQGMVQRDPNTSALYPIAITKSLHFKTKPASGNPEGRSLLRNAFRPWWFKKFIEEVEGIGIERDLAGLPKIITPQGIDIFSKQSASLYTALQDLVKNVRQDKYAGIILPFGYEFELVGSVGGKQFDTNMVIARYDQRISMTVLAQFILLGTERVGSYALASQQRDLFTTALEGWLQVIEQVINRFAVERLMRINNRLTRPMVSHESVVQPTLREITESLNELTRGGFVTPTLELENVLRRKMNVPQRTEEEAREDAEEQAEERPIDVDVAAEQIRRSALEVFDALPDVTVQDLVPRGVTEILMKAYDDAEKGRAHVRKLRNRVRRVLSDDASPNEKRAKLSVVLSLDGVR